MLKLFFNRLPAMPMPEEGRPVVQARVDRMNSIYTDSNLRAQLDLMEAELGRSAWVRRRQFQRR